MVRALSGSELATRIRDGSLSALEVVEAHIRRLEEIEPRLNALVVRTFEQALTEANAADAARARGEALGVLHGVPVTIKEQFLVAGTPTTLGLPNRALHRAKADGPLVARLRGAGAIVLGKTNVGQLLMYYESDGLAVLIAPLPRSARHRPEDDDDRDRGEDAERRADTIQISIR